VFLRFTAHKSQASFNNSAGQPYLIFGPAIQSSLITMIRYLCHSTITASIKVVIHSSWSVIHLNVNNPVIPISPLGEVVKMFR